MQLIICIRTALHWVLERALEMSGERTILKDNTKIGPISPISLVRRSGAFAPALPIAMRTKVQFTCSMPAVVDQQLFCIRLVFFWL